MRERLFRGRRMYSEEWIYSTTIFAKGDSVYMPRPNTNYIITSHADIVGDIWQIECKRPDCFYRVDPSTIGQYTGLTANGKKIFEEDIIRANHDGVVGVVGVGGFAGVVAAGGVVGVVGEGGAVGIVGLAGVSGVVTPGSVSLPVPTLVSLPLLPVSFS